MRFDQWMRRLNPERSDSGFQYSNLPEQDGQAGRRNELGRVLRVKTGYNPNSSSVGSEIPAFLALAVGAGMLTVLSLHFLGFTGRLIRRLKPRQRSGAERVEG
ncbi:MAG: hypothetical protein JSU72_02585 [Deltaproteobacteria bacterium]|nr:MAG: hypothetical protein JSU72_02585 [Deltaproteobacteria bacterium]